VSKGDRDEDTRLGSARVPGHRLLDSVWRAVLDDGLASHTP